jgi:hypothetical protein
MFEVAQSYEMLAILTILKPKWNRYLLKIEGKTRKNLVKVLDKRCSKLLKVMKWLAMLTTLKLLFVCG